MNAIVSVTRDWGIGRDGHLVVRNKADMRRFVQLTKPGTVVMGRTTFESFPAGPLKGRRNVVLSRNEDFAPAGVEMVRSVEEALAAVADDDPEHVWLIGGERVYRELLGLCRRAYVTQNDASCPCDAWFPNLDESDGWRLAELEAEGVTDEGIPYRFATYERINGGSR